MERNEQWRGTSSGEQLQELLHSSRCFSKPSPYTLLLPLPPLSILYSHLPLPLLPLHHLPLHHLPQDGPQQALNFDAQLGEVIKPSVIAALAIHTIHVPTTFPLHYYLSSRFSVISSTTITGLTKEQAKEVRSRQGAFVLSDTFSPSHNVSTGIRC